MKNISVRHTIDNDLITRWKVLWEESKEAHFFNSPEWFIASGLVYKVNKFRIITIEEDNELILVLPLVKKKVFGIPVWTYLGGKFVSKSPLLLKYVDKIVLQELIEFLIKHGDFYLSELSAEIAEVLYEANAHLIKKEASINPYLFINPDPFYFFSSKNKSQIRGIVKKHKQDISFKTFIGDEQALQTVFDLDARSSKKQQGKATFVTEQDKQFFQELVRLVPKSFVIDFVYYRNKPIIYSTGFIYKNIFYAANTAYDADYRFLRPGKLLASYRIKKLHEDKFDYLEFGRGNSALKQEFTKLTKIQYSILYVNSFFSKRWLLSTQRVYDGILRSKRLYTSYLFFKKYFFYFSR